MTTAAALAVLVVIVAVLAAAVDEGYFRGPLIRFLAARTGRLVQDLIGDRDAPVWLSATTHCGRLYR